MLGALCGTISFYFYLSFADKIYTKISFLDIKLGRFLLQHSKYFQSFYV